MTRWHVDCRQCDRTDRHTHGALATDGYELRYVEEPSGALTLDEIVARGANVHLERMSGSGWSLVVVLADGSQILANLCRRKRKVHAVAEIEPAWRRGEA